jgi:hypothetical protein
LVGAAGVKDELESLHVCSAIAASHVQTHVVRLFFGLSGCLPLLHVRVLQRTMWALRFHLWFVQVPGPAELTEAVYLNYGFSFSWPS